jgi:hypothetical protein
MYVEKIFMLTIVFIVSQTVAGTTKILDDKYYFKVING